MAASRLFHFSIGFLFCFGLSSAVNAIELNLLKQQSKIEWKNCSNNMKDEKALMWWLRQVLEIRAYGLALKNRDPLTFNLLNTDLDRLPINLKKRQIFYTADIQVDCNDGEERIDLYLKPLKACGALNQDVFNSLAIRTTAKFSKLFDILSRDKTIKELIKNYEWIKRRSLLNVFGFAHNEEIVHLKIKDDQTRGNKGNISGYSCSIASVKKWFKEGNQKNKQLVKNKKEFKSDEFLFRGHIRWLYVKLSAKDYDLINSNKCTPLSLSMALADSNKFMHKEAKSNDEKKDAWIMVDSEQKFRDELFQNIHKIKLFVEDRKSKLPIRVIKAQVLEKPGRYCEIHFEHKENGLISQLLEDNPYLFQYGLLGIGK